MDTINWFFFDLFILGYVEDPLTGTSFRYPGGLEWAIYIEVPSLDLALSPDKSLLQFREAIPTLELLGSNHQIFSQMPYTIDDDVRLVCKYLSAYKLTCSGKVGHDKGIDRLYKEGRK